MTVKLEIYTKGKWNVGLRCRDSFPNSPFLTVCIYILS